MVEAVNGMLYPAVRETARVPEVVIGEPETVSPVGTESATEVTEPFPVPKPSVLVATHASPVPVDLSTMPLVPALFALS